jgi:hypothetical protein
MQSALSAIEALNIEFAYLVDHQSGDGVSLIFASGGVMQLDDTIIQGRVGIARFYTARRAFDRTARHVISNLRIRIESDDVATGESIMTLYAQSGPPPFPASPITIADVMDTYSRSTSGAWQFSHRSVQTIFGNLPRFMPNK